MKIALDPYMLRHVPLLELPALVADHRPVADYVLGWAVAKVRETLA